MKKYFLTAVSALCIGFTAFAYSYDATVSPLSVCDGEFCTITGAGDGSTIQVTNSWQDGAKIMVNTVNDSSMVYANVTVVVEVTYKVLEPRTFSGYAMSRPATSTVIEVPIETTNGSSNNVMTGYKIKSISGSKCQ